MSDLTLRNVKGSPLTNQEVDDNFSNLNADKYQSGDSPTFTDVTADSLQITGGTGTQGTITWNDIDGTLDLDLGTATLQVGQEEHFYAKATEAIANGDVVMFAGAQGDHVLIAKANHSAVGFKPEYIMGVATQAFANNAFGYVTTFGKVRGLNTSTLNEGDILYSDPSNAGALTTTRPTAPDHVIQMAAVLSSNPAEGVILVRLTHFLDTDEVEEGSTNLYFTDARAVSAIQADASWNAANWDTAYSWGNHASAGYLTGYTESDPTVPSHVKSITTTEKANWNTAYGWGNHASVGYLTSASLAGYATQTYVNTAVSNLVDSAPATLDTLNELAAALGDDPNFATTVSTSIGTKWTQDNTKISNWDTAYGWGDHASAGYLLSSSYTASDVLTKIKTVDGSGSGLDADLLDGIDSSRIVYGSNSNKTNNTGSASANLPSGFYDQYQGDMPTATYYSYLNIRHTNVSNHHGAQIAVSFYSPDLYTRHYQGGDSSGNGSFSAWDKHWRAGNDGSGSGLDADLLDGVHGSNFLRSDTSDTATGVITFRNSNDVQIYLNGNGTTWAGIQFADVGGSDNIYFNGANKTFSIGGGGSNVAGKKLHVDGGLSVGSTSDAVATPSEGIYSQGQISVAGSTVWNAGNDGSGSGLDADLLDGVHGSSYLRSDTSDTFTGTLTINGNIYGDGTQAQGLDLAARATHTEAQLPSAWGDYVRTWEFVEPTDWPTFGVYGYVDNINMYSNSAAWQFFYSYNDLTNQDQEPIRFRHSHYSTDSWGAWRELIDTGARTQTKSGGLNLGGNLDITGNVVVDTQKGFSNSGAWTRNATPYGYIDFGPANTSYAHIYTDRPAFYLNKDMYVNGALVWNAGNDGSGSGLDADLLDGYHSAENGGSINLRTASNGYSQLQNWTNVAGAGLYSTTVNGAHFYPNSGFSYGVWRVDGSRNNYTGIVFDSGGDTVTGMFDSSGNGGDYNTSSGWHFYYYRANGCLGVAGSTTSSSYGLYEQGGGIYSTGNITAYSDARVKENIRTIDNALYTVEQMRGVYYNRIDDEEKKTVIGFIAQEVDAIEGAKPLVTYAEDVDQYGVSYGNATALLVEAVKELSQQVKDLQAELKELKNG